MSIESNRNEEELELMLKLLMKTYRELGGQLDMLDEAIHMSKTFVMTEPSLETIKKLKRIIKMIGDLV